MNRNFKPTPTPIAFAMWEHLGRLELPLLPTAGIKYVESGGPTTYIGKGRK
jgi:hypothetical protein